MCITYYIVSFYCLELSKYFFMFLKLVRLSVFYQKCLNMFSNVHSILLEVNRVYKYQPN